MGWFWLSKQKKASLKNSKRKPVALLVRSILFFLLPCIFLIFHSWLPAAAFTPKYYNELQFPPLPEIQVPKYTRYQMANGITVYLMEDRELPLVGGSAIFRTGDIWDSADKIGLGELVGTVMRSGGTRSHSADELNELLEQRAASVETSISNTSGGASFQALSENLEEVLGLFAEVIREPAFPQDKLDLAKTQIRGEIARRNDEPNGIAHREFQKLIYGKDSPFVRNTEYATIKNVSRQDLIDFYQKNFHPNNMILGLIGDFDSREMKSLIEKKFGDWKSDRQWQASKLPTVSQANTNGVFLVDRPELTQSSVLIGHLGGMLNNPDYAALSVLNDVFNGFGGRMFNQIRARKGLAYSVYAMWSPRYDYPGTFVAGGQTRSEATVPFIQAIREEIDRARNELITPAELAYAKESALNSFIFKFQDPSQTLSRLMRYEYYGYPSDFIFSYRRQVEATTIADVQRVAKKYLKPDNLVTLVVGNSQSIKPPLTNLGSTVKQLDITIPDDKSS